MKRYGNLFGSIVSFQALLAASRKARRGKRYKVSTARFEHNLERELIRLHRQLTQKSYRPGPYREFKIYEPKPRKISAAPYRDRVAFKEFQSGIRKMKAPVLPKSSETAKPETSAFAEREDTSEPGPVSSYIDKVYKRVYSKWKTPLGTKDNNVRVNITFNIFKGGNIDKPVISKSTGDENLDSLALKAIHDSAPFPPLPKEWKPPHLKVNMLFRYVPVAN